MNSLFIDKTAPPGYYNYYKYCKSADDKEGLKNCIAKTKELLSGEIHIFTNEMFPLNEERRKAILEELLNNNNFH